MFPEANEERCKLECFDWTGEIECANFPLNDVDVLSRKDKEIA
jgi:hypothetical protein